MFDASTVNTTFQHYLAPSQWTWKRTLWRTSDPDTFFGLRMAFLKIVWPLARDGISKNGLPRTSPHLSQPFPLALEEKVEHSVTMAAIELILLGLFKDHQKSIKSDY